MVIKTVALIDIRIPDWSWHIVDAIMEHKLETSLQKFGQIRPLVINTAHELIDGRFIFGAMQRLGWTEAHCLIVDGGVDIALALELKHDIDYIVLAQQIRDLPDSIVATAPFSAVNMRHYRTLSERFDWSQFDLQEESLFPEPDESSTPALPTPPIPPTPPTHLKIPTETRLGATTSAAQRLAAILAPAPLRIEPGAPVLTSTVTAQPPLASRSTSSLLDMLMQENVLFPLPGSSPGFRLDFERHVTTWTPSEPPSLDNIHDIVLNVETDGLRWYTGDRPAGITVGSLDGQLKRFLPFRFAGGNLDEETVRRWAQRELRNKHIVNANTRFDIHNLREWGVDLEEQGCTFSDVQHYAALLDEYRRQFSLDVLVKDFLNTESPPRVDESRMVTYHAGDVAARAEFQIEAVARLRAVMWLQLDKEELQNVRQLEDDVIPVVCEMEKNAAHIDRLQLRHWIVQSGQELTACLLEVAKDVGFEMNPDRNEDWQKLFAYYKIPVTKYTEPSQRFPEGQPSFSDNVLKSIEHPKVQLARRAGKIASLRSKFLLAYDQVIGDDNKLRFALHQLRGDEYGTIRGRFSMSGGGRGDPHFGANLQQVMRVNSQREAFGFNYDDSSHDAEIYLVRALFIPERGEYLSADAQAIEYRLAAHFANSEQLIKAYERDTIQLQEGRLTDKWVDFHGVTGDIIRPYKDLSRNIIKNANFCLVYGGGEETATRTMGVTPSEGREIVGIWRERFPEFKALHRRAMNLAETKGYVKTILGRRARFKASMDAIDIADVIGKGKSHFHAALNYVIQGSAADIMKMKLVELHKARKMTGFLMRQTVHDEVDGDATTPETADMVRALLNRQSFNLKVPIVWEVNTGPNWAACK